MTRKLILILIILLTAVSSDIFADSERDLVIERFNKFLEYMRNGQYDPASLLWLREYTNEVYKFGISYPDVPFKLDAGSVLEKYINDYKNDKFDISYSIIPEMFGVYKIILILRPKSGGENDLLRAEFYLMRADDKNFYLVPHFWPMLESMNVKEGKYFKLYYFKESQVNDSALAATDRRIQEIAEVLGIEADELERLSFDKLNYFLCENTNQVIEYSGQHVPGWHDPASNFIVTSLLPHPRILADFLIKYKLRDIPSYTLPVMEKGLSVYFGGRAGTAFPVFSQMVSFSLQSDFLKLEDILCRSDFDEKTGGPDFSYTLAGYFAGYLLERFGIEKTLILYRALSGREENLRNRPGDDVKKIIKEYIGLNWQDIEKEFSEYFKQRGVCGFEMADVPAEGNIVFQSGSPLYSVTVYDQGDKYIIDAFSFDKTTPVKAAILLKNNSSQYKSEYKSTLFSKHFPKEEYQDQFFGIIFNVEEIGTYNYLQDEITGKYITSLSEKTAQIDPAHLTFSFDKNLMTGDFGRLKAELVNMP